MVSVVSACTTESLNYGLFDVETGDLLVQCDPYGYDEESELYSDALYCDVEAGDYCLVFLDDQEASLDYVFYLEIHVHEYVARVTEPGCEQDGYTSYVCDCGDSFVDDYRDPLGHDFAGGSITSMPEECLHALNCGRCGYSVYEDCTLGGKTSVDATCTADGYESESCTVCGAVYLVVIPATGHDVAGVTAKFDVTTKTHSRKCRNCGEAVVENCTFDAGEVLETATMNRPGMKKYTCSGCSGTYQDLYLYRVSGKGRCETAVAAAAEMKAILGVKTFDTIILACGDNFADALTGSYLATVKGAPILLYRASGMELNLQYIEENLSAGGTVYILGGTAAIPADVEEMLAGYNTVRLSGSSRFDTNLKILEEAGMKPGQEILVCTGYNFADSLSASAVGLPILMVNNGAGVLTDNQVAFLKKTGKLPLYRHWRYLCSFR